jgi:hypothetical protein
MLVLPRRFTKAAAGAFSDLSAFRGIAMTVESNNAPTAAHAFCPWCGGQLVRGARFCPGCGEATGEVSAVPDTPPAAWVAEEMDPRAEELPADVEETLPIWESAAVTGDEPVQARRVDKPSRRWMTVGAAALAVLLVAILAGTFGFRYLQDRPVHAAFGAAQQVFSPMVESFAEASDLEQVGFAGERAEDAVDRLTTRRAAIVSADTELARSMVPVIDAQVAAAQAGALLAGIDGSELSVWGEAHGSLATALEDLVAATKLLQLQDAESAQTVVDGQAMLSNLETVVGTAVAKQIEASVQRLLGELTSAKKTADVRATAEAATRDLQAGEAALKGMTPNSPQAEHLEASLAVNRAIAGLDLLDGATLGDWPSLRQSLTAALGSVPSDSPLVADGQKAVVGLNKLVARADSRLSDWQAAYDGAVQEKAADSTALAEYAAAMEAAMRRYSTLRSDLSDWIDRVESPNAYVTYDEAYSVLSQAQWDRQVIRDEMNGLPVPADVRAAHGELVSVVDDAIAAMQAAYDGATDSNYCMTSCYYKETPGWTRFSSESGRITEAYRTADQGWQAAVAAAKSSVESRTLPRKPQV